MAKRKISFDIDEDIFKTIKLLSNQEKIGQGELLRRAVKKYIENEIKNITTMTIFVPCNGKIEKFIIPISTYNNEDEKIVWIDFHETDKNLKELIPNVDKQGTLSVLQIDTFVDTVIDKDALSKLGYEKRLIELLEKNKGSINFFTVND